MKLVRWILGRIILFVDFLTPPKSVVREKSAQEKIDVVTANMSLYQFEACPFCVKVRRQLRKLALDVELRDAKNDLKHKDQLTNEGGKHKVPCLRIDKGADGVTWLYDSKEIISYLEAEFQT